MPTSSWNTRYPMNIQRGEDFWDDDLNAILDQLVIDVEFRDVLNNRSGYTSEARSGSKFLATDTGDIYRYNGTNWRHIPTTGRTPALDGLEGSIVGGGSLTSLLGANLSLASGSLSADRYEDSEARNAVSGELNVNDLSSGFATSDYVPKADGQGGIDWEAESGGSGGSGGSSSAGFQATKSGDGSTTSFTISHSLGEIPRSASVIAASEEASTDFWVSGKSSTDITITYARAPVSGTDNLQYDVILSIGPNTYADSYTLSGDGTTTTFTLSHGLSVIPTAVNVDATSADASTDFWVSAKSDSSIDVSYYTAPSAGTDNLGYDLLAIE
jgi:hypothetical protein